jgi:hypothetical protein
VCLEVPRAGPDQEVIGGFDAFDRRCFDSLLDRRIEGSNKLMHILHNLFAAEKAVRVVTVVLGARQFELSIRGYQSK